MISETEYKLTKLGQIPADWELTTVGKALKIVNNKRKPISEEERKKIQGPYPYYGPTKIQDYINEYNYDGKYALIAEDGDHFLKYSSMAMTQLAEGKFNVNNHAHALQGTKKCTTEWFYWFYYHRSIFSHLTRQGAGRYKLNKAALEVLPIALPPIAEQQAITSILFTWDMGINKLQKLIASKQKLNKVLVQQLLAGNKRLKNFDNNWRLLKFQDIYTPIKKKAGDIKYLVLSVTKDGIVSQSEYFNKEIASEDTAPYLVVKKGDMVMSGLNFWMGSIDVLTQYESGMVSPAYKVFRIHNKDVSPEFMRFYVRSHIMKRALVGASVQGASIVRRNLDMGILNEWSFRFPAFEEQTKIAEVLHIAEKEIEVLRTKLNALKQQKKGLMQKLLTGQIRVNLKAEPVS